MLVSVVLQNIYNPIVYETNHWQSPSCHLSLCDLNLSIVNYVSTRRSINQIRRLINAGDSQGCRQKLVRCEVTDVRYTKWSKM